MRTFSSYHTNTIAIAGVSGSGSRDHNSNKQFVIRGLKLGAIARLASGAAVPFICQMRLNQAGSPSIIYDGLDNVAGNNGWDYIAVSDKSPHSYFPMEKFVGNGIRTSFDFVLFSAQAEVVTFDMWYSINYQVLDE